MLGCSRTYNSKGSVSYYGNYDEMWDMLEFAFDNYRVCRLLHEGQAWSQFTVANGENQVVGQTNTAMDVVLPKDATTKNGFGINGKAITIQGTAPIQKGQKIATMQISYQNSYVAETELFAMSAVRSVTDENLQIQSATRDDSNVTGVLSFVGILCLVILIPLVLYLVVNNVRRAVARNRRRRRRRSRRRSRG